MMGKMSLLDTILFNVFETDYRLDIIVKEAEFKGAKFSGPCRYVSHTDLISGSEQTIHIPLDDRYGLEKPVDSVFLGKIVPSSSVATIGLSGWLEPHTAKGHNVWFNRDYELKFCLTNKEVFKIPYGQHEMLLDQIIAGEIDFINQAIGEGMIFEGERVWKTFSNSSYFLDMSSYRKRLFSKLPSNLASRVQKRAKDVETIYKLQLKQNA